MKKLIAVIFLVFAVLIGIRAAELSSFTVNLPTDTSALEFSPLVFQSESVVTNISYVWENAEVSRTNGMFEGNEVVTYTVRQQVPVETVSTNAEVWTTSFQKIIPANVSLRVDDRLDASFRRQTVADIRMSLSPAELQAVLGDDLYALTLQSAQAFGSVPVSGGLEAALRTVVLEVQE